MLAVWTPCQPNTYSKLSHAALWGLRLPHPVLIHTPPGGSTAQAQGSARLNHTLTHNSVAAIMGNASAGVGSGASLLRQGTTEEGEGGRSASVDQALKYQTHWTAGKLHA